MNRIRGSFDRHLQIASVKRRLETHAEFSRLSHQTKLTERDAVELLHRALAEIGGKGLTVREAAMVCNLGWSRSRRILGLYFRARRYLSQTFYTMRPMESEMIS